MYPYMFMSYSSLIAMVIGSHAPKPVEIALSVCIINEVFCITLLLRIAMPTVDLSDKLAVIFKCIGINSPIYQEMVSHIALDPNSKGIYINNYIN